MENGQVNPLCDQNFLSMKRGLNTEKQISMMRRMFFCEFFSCEKWIRTRKCKFHCEKGI